MSFKVVLEMTQEHAQALSSALDLFTRLGLGQIEALSDLVHRGEIPFSSSNILFNAKDEQLRVLQAKLIERSCLEIKKSLGLVKNQSRGLSHPDNNPKTVLSWELKKTVDLAMSAALDCEKRKSSLPEVIDAPGLGLDERFSVAHSAKQKGICNLPYARLQAIDQSEVVAEKIKPNSARSSTLIAPPKVDAKDLSEIDPPDGGYYTPAYLLDIANRACEDYKTLRLSGGALFTGNEADQAYSLYRRALLCARWMLRHRHKKLRYVGPMGCANLQKGDRVRIRAGSVFFASSKFGEMTKHVLDRAQTVTVRSVVNKGAIELGRVVQPSLTWYGSGGKFRTTDLNNVEWFDRYE